MESDTSLVWDLLLQLLPARNERDPMRHWQMWAIVGVIIALGGLVLLIAWLVLD